MTRKKIQFGMLWQVIMGAFILAAMTGVVYRMGMLMPLADGLSLQNIRHAHSHLMFFAWATPLPLYLFWRHILPVSLRDQRGYAWMYWGLGGMLLFGIVSYPFFLTYGYRSVAIGQAELPLSVIASGMVMLCWYLYAVGYLTIRGSLSEKEINPWFESALVMLVVCSLGAWGVAVVQALGVENPLAGKGLTHFFLATYTEGWVVLALLGLIDYKLGLSPNSYRPSAGTLALLIMMGAPLTFSYGISESLLTTAMEISARAGGLAAGAACALAAWVMLKRANTNYSLFFWPLLLLMLKGSVQVIASIIPETGWLSDHALRIWYLHLLLLGGLTLGGFAFMQSESSLSSRAYHYVTYSIIAVLVSLLLLTRFWPVELGGYWVYHLVFWTALLPGIAAAIWWYLASGAGEPSDYR